MEFNVMTKDDWEMFCAEYEDWLRNVWTPFMGGETDEPQT